MAERRPTTPSRDPRRRRLRNWALLGALAGFVVLVYLVALVKMGFFQ